MASLPVNSPITSLQFSALDRAETTSLPTQEPQYGQTCTTQATGYLPFTFGAQFEMIIRSKAHLIQAVPVSERHATYKQFRDFNLLLLKEVSQILSSYNMLCDVYGFNSSTQPDYSRWNAMLDGSISKKHIYDGFYPVEIVSPKIIADPNWVRLIDGFWSIMLEHFELRLDASCGFHVHISTSTGFYSPDQVRMMAKAVIFWEPATARCAPPSRQDAVLDFCRSNVNPPVPVAGVLERYGPLRGLPHAYDYIDNATTDEVIDYICPNKYLAWNFRPCKQGGHGSIEFRRAPASPMPRNQSAG